VVRHTYVPDRGDAVWLQFNPQAGHEQAGRSPALVRRVLRGGHRRRLCRRAAAQRAFGQMCGCVGIVPVRVQLKPCVATNSQSVLMPKLPQKLRRIARWELVGARAAHGLPRRGAGTGPLDLDLRLLPGAASIPPWSGVPHSTRLREHTFVNSDRGEHRIYPAR
jgi:mRNA-degrading endonuclease toxin of MazEF toxin-antitoxin module